MFFLSVLFRTLWDSLFQIGKRRDPPQTFDVMYKLKGRHLSLICSLTLQGIIIACHESARLSAKLSKTTIKSAENQPLNPADSTSTARPLNSATRRHSHPRLRDRVKTAIGNPPSQGLSARLVCKGPCAQGYHRLHGLQAPSCVPFMGF